MIQQLYWRFTAQADAVRWHRYLDWLFILPREDEREVWQRVLEFETGRNGHSALIPPREWGIVSPKRQL